MRYKEVMEKVDATMQAIATIHDAGEARLKYPGNDEKYDTAVNVSANVVVQNVIYGMAAIEIIKDLDRMADREIRKKKKPFFSFLRKNSGFEESIYGVLERRSKRYSKKVNNILKGRGGK